MKFFNDDFFRHTTPLLRQMNRLMDDAVSVPQRAFPSVWKAHCDARETDKEYVISAELPGINKEDITVDIDKNNMSLKIQGETKYESSSGNMNEAEETSSATKTTEAGQQQTDVTTTTDKQKQPALHQAPQYHFQERRFGTFVRSFALPRDANLDEIKASHNNGILNITIPKRLEKITTEKIPIE